MYCEKLNIQMDKSTCIDRQKWHEKPSGTMPWFKSSEGCRNCVQGKKVYKNHPRGKAMGNEKVSLKKCSKCGKEKPGDKKHFWQDISKDDGLFIWCKECANKSSKKSYNKKSTKSVKKAVLVKPAEKLKPHHHTIPDINKNISLNFSAHESLLAEINASAEDYFRTPEMQILWWLSNRDNPSEQGK